MRFEGLRLVASGAAACALALVAAVVMVRAAAASQRTAWSAVQDADAASPTWSPDGKQITFVYIRAAGCCHVTYRYQIVRRSSTPGGAVHTIHAGKTDGPAFPVAWAAGGQILFDVGDGLEHVGVRGGNPKAIRSPSCRGLCRPDGFILSPYRELAALNLGGGDPHEPLGIGLLSLTPGRSPVVLSTPLTAQEDGGGITDGILDFSPDGSQLAFSRYPWDVFAGDVTGPQTLMAYRFGGGQPAPLTQSGIPGASLVPNDVWAARWSPDGRWVAYVRNQTLEVVPTTGETAPRVLATDFGPCAHGGDTLAWSPTSTLIAYDGCPDQGAARLTTVRPDGTHATDLLNGRPLTYVSDAEVAEASPQWSPDGSRLLFLARATGHRAVHVWTIRPNGRDLTRLG
jgi:Tol biopolymer transport system component